MHASLDKAKAGDTIVFGKYEQDGVKANGKEPIEWIVLKEEDNNILVLSKYVIPFNEKPKMKSKEITDQLCKAIESKKYMFLRCNFPNGDMVGHTGNYDATIIGVESVDLALARVKAVCDKVGATLIVTADHGNADEMYDKRKKETDPIKPKTSHTLARVPFIIYNADVKIKEGDFGLSNIAATLKK